MRYDPALYLPDARLRARIAGLGPVERAALAEALCGNMSTHVVYATRAADAPPAPDASDPAAVPVLREMPGAELARHIRPDGTLPFLFDGLPVPFALPPLASAILKLVDGERTRRRHCGGAVRPGRRRPRSPSAWAATYATLSSLNRLLLAPPA